MEKPDHSPDLTALHTEWQQVLNEIIAGGTAYADAAEAMFTVAVVAKLKAGGTREAARTLYLVATQLATMADREEADAAAPRH